VGLARQANQFGYFYASVFEHQVQMKRTDGRLLRTITRPISTTA